MTKQIIGWTVLALVALAALAALAVANSMGDGFRDYQQQTVQTR